MPNLQNDGDKYTGEIYESMDKRSPGRRICITEKYNGIVFERYHYVTITNPGDPSLVGRVGSIRARTLDTRWLKVSH